MIEVSIITDDSKKITYNVYNSSREEVKTSIIETIESHPFIAVLSKEMDVLLNTKHIIRIEVKDVDNNVDN